MATFKDSHEFFSSSKKKFSQEKNPLESVGGEVVEGNEFFSSSKRKSSQGKNPRGRRGGGYGGHKGEYLKIIFY